MSRFASGVTVVTTLDATGVPTGFTASAFSSLSLHPPLVLVCLDRRAECFETFRTAPNLAISILARGQDATATPFGTRGADKFGAVQTTPGEASGMPLIDGALAQVECRTYARFDGGDHVILVGEVLRTKVTAVEPLLHYNRAFGHFSPR